MRIAFYGAAHEVTGSCTVISAGGKNILIDCGMEQGPDIYENGQLRYEITRIPGGNTAADVTVEISRSADDYSISYDNMGGLIVSMSY